MKRKFLVFFTALMALIMVLTVVACADYTSPTDDEDDNDIITRTQLITNGTFYNASSSSSKDLYVKDTVSGWTATKGSLATTANGVSMGVINLENEATFVAQSDKFTVTGGTFDYPGVDTKTPYDTDDEGKTTADLQDTNAILLASIVNAGSIYYKNASSFSLQADKYYLLQYSVCTNIDYSEVDAADKDKKGAGFVVTGGVQYEHRAIDTNGAWQTYYLYIESNKLTSKNIDIRLWLGDGPEKVNSVANVYATRGAVLFDNIICTEVENAVASSDFNVKTINPVTAGTVKLTHTAFQNLSDANIGLKLGTETYYGFESMYYLPDLKLEQMTETTPTSTNSINYYYSFREGVYTSSNVNNYTLVKGEKDLASADQPTVTNAFTGIVDLSKMWKVGDDGSKTDTYKNLLPTSYTFDAPTYELWRKYLAPDSNNGRNMAALDETKALMIYHNDLSGAGFTGNSTITIEKNTFYKISVWAFVWMPVDDNDEIVLPTVNKPTVPTDLTVAQKAIINFRDKVNSAYFDALTEGEKAVVAKASTDFLTDAELAYFNAFANEMERPSGDDEQNELNSILTNYYLYEDVKDMELSAVKTLAGAAGSNITQELLDKYVDYLHYMSLKERSTILSDTYVKVQELEKKWKDYDNDYTDYIAKYNIWKNNNAGKPYATVKLTGAGDDLVEKTAKVNDGWEMIEFYVKGNQLSSRALTMELWFGEGNSTSYATLMMGGVFFDNISITEIPEETAIDMEQTQSVIWSVLSPINTLDELNYGSLVNNDAISDTDWTYSLGEGDVAASDLNQVSLQQKATDAIGKLEINGSEVNFYELILKNKTATASMLKAEKQLEVNPNTAYRFALWVKTVGIAEGKGVTIHLMAGEDADSLASVSSVASFNSGDITEDNDGWKEVVFYIMGDVLEKNLIALNFTMGSGSKFSTDNYIEGELHIAAISYTVIKYSEFNSSSKSGDEIKNYTFSNTAAASESVTNGSFSSISYTDTKETEFDANGKLTGVGVTSNWTKGTAKNNTYNTVELSHNSTDKRLEWSGVVGIDKEGKDTAPDGYEVYVTSKGADGKSKEIYVGYVAKQAGDAADEQNHNYTFSIPDNRVSGSFRVRAVSTEGLGGYSSYIAVDGDDVNGLPYDEFTGTAKKEFSAGTINTDGLDLFNGSDYFSPYSTVMMIESNYKLGYSMTSSSKSLSASSFYVVSVWVRTEPGTAASITLKNISNVLTASSVTENYIGFANVDTNGAWVQYRFYIKTGNTSSSLQIELSLGNPYANKVSKKNDNVKTSTSVYDDADLSLGKVYFDAVRVLTMTEDEYEAAMDMGENDAGGNIAYYNLDRFFTGNKYAFRLLEYTADSFDSFTENTTSEGTDGYNLGQTPNNYTWAKASDATGTTEQQRLYGVYSEKDDVSKKSALYTNSEDGVDTNVFEKFMPENFDMDKFLAIEGTYSLVMSNKVPYGQRYTSSSSSTINAGTYYKLTFLAKTLIVKEVTAADGTVTYETEGVNGEFRYMPTGSTDKYESILVNSATNSNDLYTAVEYTMYIYNPSTTSSAAKWAFYLGDDADSNDTTGTKQFLMGMMVIDQVKLVAVSEADYKTAKEALGYDDLSKEALLKSATRFYDYDEDDKTDEGGDEEKKDDEKEKDSIWTGGTGWLLISSIVLGAMIIAVMIVMLIRQIQKKHPRAVKGENVVKVEKEIRVVPATPQVKEDFVENREYSDELVKPKYVQRTVQKKKKKK